MTTTSCQSRSLEEAFEKVAKWVRQSPPPTGMTATADGQDNSTATAISTAERLRLYGLYKHCTAGPCSGEDAPSLLRIEASAKYRAWEACQNMSKETAMKDYITLIMTTTASSPQSGSGLGLSEKCHQLLSELEEAAGTETENNLGRKGGEEKNKKQGGNRKDGPELFDANDPKRKIFLSNNHNEKKTSFFARLKSIPRGQLDISYADLAFAASKCFDARFGAGPGSSSINCYHSLEKQISDIWMKSSLPSPAVESPDKDTGTGRSSAACMMVGLSVRSLLDLYLSAKQYPEGSEIIVTPPINVPGMMLVLQHHKIVAVGVDLMESEPSELPTNDEDENSNYSGRRTSLPLIGVNCEAIGKAIGSKTVAILVVHPFGMVSATEEQMEHIQALAQQNNCTDGNNKKTIDVLEDCAEVFTGFGTGCYLGSSHADISFFSFGPIKTATCLGGGIAVFRHRDRKDDDKNTAVMESMKRLHFYLYPQQQTNQQFLFKVAKSCVMRMVTDFPLVFGLLSHLCFCLGLDFDAFVTYCVRGFTLPSNTDSKQRDRGDDNDTDNNPISRNTMMRQLRQRPSKALLAVMHRRLKHSSGRVVPSVSLRVEQCQRLTQILLQEVPNVVLPEIARETTTSSNNSLSTQTFWLYPTQLGSSKRKPEQVRRHLQQDGFDATQGASQLLCVAAPEKCPLATRFMKEVLYLPLPNNPTMSNSDMLRLAKSLGKVTSGNDLTRCSGSSSVGSCASSPRRHRLFHSKRTLLALVLFWCIYVFPFHSILRRAMATVELAIVACVVVIISCHGLRSLAVKTYLESWCFAIYSRLHFDEDLTIYSGQQEKRDPNTTNCNSSSKGILSSIQALDLPQRTTEERCKVILTGATGFIGSMLLRDLLFHRKTLSIDGVIVVCRAKRGTSAKDRILKLLNTDMFSFLTQIEKDKFVDVVNGDVTAPNVGLCKEDLDRISCDDHITHIIHCAASVSFTLSLPEAAMANISSALQLQSLTARLRNKSAQFVHLSTAFVHGGQTGSASQSLPEELFSLSRYDALEIYQSMMGTEFYASKAMRDLQFPNSYAFSKCVCEHLLTQNNVNTTIVRPNIVGPAVENPHEGWAGERPSTLVAAACLYLSYQWNVWSCGSQNVSCIPVDVLSQFVLTKAFDENLSSSGIKGRKTDESVSSEEALSSEEEYEKISRLSNDSFSSISYNSSQDKNLDLQKPREHRIYNAAWNSGSSDGASFTWREYAVAIVQLGSVLGHFSKATAYLGLVVATRFLPKVRLTTEQFEKLHSTLVLFPIRMILQACCYCGIHARGLRKLYKFLDLPLLFFPFMSNDFYFYSELTPPTHFSGKRYLFSCVNAAHLFIKKAQAYAKGVNSSPAERSNKVKRSDTGSPFLLLAGSSYSSNVQDWFWALTQPRGNYFIRFGGWLLRKILRSTCSEVTVDVQSFSLAMSKLKAVDNAAFIVLAPAHRSFFDFLVLSFTFFAVPELQIDIPFIAAADEFQSLTFIGWLASCMRAFFLHRDRGQVDPSLAEKIRSIQRHQDGNTKPVLEVFIEGKRSRDRRFIPPKTGLLRAMQNVGGKHVILPISISYERIPEQDRLAKESSGEIRSRLSVMGTFKWLKLVATKQINLGRVHVSVSDPIVMDSETKPDCNALVNEIQRRQQERIYISMYHVLAASRLLELDPSTVKKSLLLIGCNFLPERPDICTDVHLPFDTSELCTIVFQASPLLAALVRPARPKWSKWLHHLPSSDQQKVTIDDSGVTSLKDALLRLFDGADNCVQKALVKLREQRFHNPKSSHVFQTAKKLNDHIPDILLLASVSMIHLPNSSASERQTSAIALKENDILLKRSYLNSNESLGSWGFSDSSFVVTAGSGGGVPSVTMRGNRYASSGKQITGLIPFIEAEMGMQIDLATEAFRESSSVVVPQCRLEGADLDALKMAVAEVSMSSPERIRHGTGHSQEDMYLIRSGNSFRVPDIVAWPSSEAQVQSLVSLAKQRGWCLLPFGGGTNVTHATRCPSVQDDPRPMISLDMKKLNRVLSVNQEDGVAHIEAGITGRDLVKEMESRGYTIGHEPDSIEFSTLGGWIATKASGMKRNKYGNIEDIVKNVRVVGSDGRILQHGINDECAPSFSGPSWGRESSGFDLKNLMLGSEGCLGIITSATVRIWPLPNVRDFESVLLRDFDHGLQFLRGVSRQGESRIPASIRLLDNEHFRLGQAMRPKDSTMSEQIGRALKKLWVGIQGSSLDPLRVVCAIINYEGSQEEVLEQKRIIAHHCALHEGIRLGPSLGKAGYNLTFMIAYLRDFAMTFHLLGESFETFSPWSAVDKIVQATKERIRKEHAARFLPGKPFIGCRVTQIYHEGVCLYFYFAMNFENVDNASAVFSAIEHSARAEILRRGGSLSHHHGVGKVRSAFLKDIDSPAFQDAIQSIKRSMDPEQIFGAQNGPFSHQESE